MIIQNCQEKYKTLTAVSHLDVFFQYIAKTSSGSHHKPSYKIRHPTLYQPSRYVIKNVTEGKTLAKNQINYSKISGVQHI